MTTDRLKTHDWVFSVGTWNAQPNADGSRGVVWRTTPSSTLDLDPVKVAVDIAKDRVFQQDTLVCLTEIQTGRRYEIVVKATHAITHSVLQCREVGQR